MHYKSNIISKIDNTSVAGILLYLLLFMVSAVYGQNPPVRSPQGIQSPEAASLGKFGDVPVSYYTGTPDITVPLYTIRSGGLEVPVTLSYHASGIKVDEIASWVGLGWALNAGGVITRTIRGIADEKSNGYLATYDSLYSDTNWPIAQSSMRSFSGCPSSDFACLVQHGAVDTEPDIYFYNFNRHAGKFVHVPPELDPEEIVLIPYKNLDISQTAINEWTIITDDGTRYVFGSPSGVGPEVESIFDDSQTYWDGNVAEGSPAGRGLYNSGWWLREIHPAGSNGTIRFYYERATQQAAWRDKISEVEQLSRCTFAAGTYFVTSDKRVRATMQRLTTYQPYLTRIETPSETISFISSLDRQDQPFGTTGLRKLEEIKVFSKNGTLKKHVKLDHGSFNSGQADAERLRLESIREIPVTAGSAGPTWQFDYIDQADGVQLPAYGSFDRDHWGYYNGAGNTNSALPEISELDIAGANREPDSVAMQAGLLEQITWPTGGYTQITYEPHDYSRIGIEWIPEQEIIEQEVDRQDEADFYVMAVDSWSAGEITSLTQNDWIEREFTIESIENSVELSLDIFWPTRHSENNQNVIVDFAEVEMVDAANGSVLAVYQLEEDPGNPGAYLTHTQKEKLVSPGNYKIRLRGVSVCDGGSCDFSWNGTDYIADLYFHVLAGWTETYQDTTINDLSHMAGGVRVKTIRTNDGINPQTEKVEHFSYRVSSNPERSSGVILNEPINYYEIPFSNCQNVKQRSASSYIPLGSLGGRHVGYSEVQVSYGENGEGGKKIFRYTSAGDFPDIAYPESHGKAFYRANTSNEWRRGHLTQSESYSASGALLLKETTEYNFHTDGMPLIDGQFDPYNFYMNYDDDGYPLHPLVSVLRASSYTFPVSSIAKDGAGGTWYVTYAVQSPYYLVGGRYHPETERVEVHDASTGNYRISETRYLYEEGASSPALGKLRQVEETTSDGLNRTKIFRYAHEITNDGQGVDYTPMHNLHMLSQPYSVTILDGEYRVVNTTFTLWSNSTGWWRPREEWIWTGGNPYGPDFNLSN